MLGTAQSQRKENTPEVSQPEKLEQLLKVSYNEWKSLAKQKGAKASILWVIEAQMGAESCNEDIRGLHGSIGQLTEMEI